MVTLQHASVSDVEHVEPEPAAVRMPITDLPSNVGRPPFVEPLHAAIHSKDVGLWSESAGQIAAVNSVSAHGLDSAAQGVSIRKSPLQSF